MRSSGQLATTTPRHVMCAGEMVHTFPLFGIGPKFTRRWDCTFMGVVDVDVDPEVREASWVCPRCGTVQDISSEVF